MDMVNLKLTDTKKHPITAEIIDNLPLVYSSRERELIKKICGCIYDNYDKSQDAVDLVERIARFLDK